MASYSDLKSGGMQIFAFSKRFLGYFGKDKNPETGEGLLRTRISSNNNNNNNLIKTIIFTCAQHTVML